MNIITWFVALGLFGAVLTGCARDQVAAGHRSAANTNRSPAATVSALENTTWRLEALCGVPVKGDQLLTLAFGKDGSISGSGGVNRFSSGMRVENGALTVRPITATKRGGPAESMAQESRFFKALTAATKLEITGNSLHIICAGESKPLVFKRSAP
jgi:heat shock protein HslJ